MFDRRLLMALAANSMAGSFIDMSNGGGVGLINFLIVPAAYSNYVNNEYISEDVEIKESETPKLYSQIKSAFDQQFFVYPIAFIVTGKNINTDNTDNPYFVTENITTSEMGSILTPYDNINLYSVTDGNKIISFEYMIIYNKRGKIRIKYNPSNETIFVNHIDE